MSKHSSRAASTAGAILLAASSAFAAHADDALTIDNGALAGCFGGTTCVLDGAKITATGGPIASKTDHDVTGFGVGNGAAGAEIDIDQNLRIDYDATRSILAIRILFLYNGPEFNDRAEIAQITADGKVYSLSVNSDVDDADAVWSGPGTVSKCGDTTATGSGCFVITDPFPGAVSRLDFTAVQGNAPFAGLGNNESDYSIGNVDAGAEVVVDLENCAGAEGCPIASENGDVAASLNSVNVTNPNGSTAATVIRVRIPDCRYIPQVCVNLLPPNDYAATEDAARAILINLGVIRPLVSLLPDKLAPAAELLNVTPLLPPEVKSNFDSSGKPPNGLPPMYIGSRWRGQDEINHFWIDALFFVTDAGVVFSDTFEGLIDVSDLTGHELGCVANLSNLRAWDMITSVSERAKSVGGRFADKLLNVGCINPTKVSGDRLSLYSVNLEVAPDTYGPTIKSLKPKLTVNNDAVFARLVESLWIDLGETKALYACRQADPVPHGGAAPLGKPACNNLAVLWTRAAIKIALCVNSTFYPASASGTALCTLARDRVSAFEAALPATASGPDPYNRLGELKARTDVFQHVWEERFLKSLKANGFCREKGTCPP